MEKESRHASSSLGGHRSSWRVPDQCGPPLASRRRTSPPPTPAGSRSIRTPIAASPPPSTVDGRSRSMCRPTTPATASSLSRSHVPTGVRRRSRCVSPSGPTAATITDRRGQATGHRRRSRSSRPSQPATITLTMPTRHAGRHRPTESTVPRSVAVERGPVVMCVESVDLPPAGTSMSSRSIRLSPERGGRAVVVSGQSSTLTTSRGRTAPAGRAHGHRRQRSTPLDVRLTPYHDWGNRGPSTMRVWIPARTEAQPGRR